MPLNLQNRGPVPRDCQARTVPCGVRANEQNSSIVRSALPFQAAGMWMGRNGLLLSVSVRSPKSGELPAAIKSDQLDDDTRRDEFGRGR